MRMKKRIFSFIFALVFFAVSIFSKVNTMTAQATAIPMDSTFSTEFVMALYSVWESSMIIGGAKEGLDEYSSGADAWDAFCTFIQDISGPDVEGILGDSVISLDDGTVLTGTQIQAFLDSYTDGSSALALPDEDTWARFRVIDGGGSGDNNGNEEDPEEPEEPENPFSRIKSMIIGSGFVTQVADFVKALFNGETELDPAIYFSDSYYLYTGEIPQDANGNYIFKADYYCSVSRLHYTINVTSQKIPMYCLYFNPEVGPYLFAGQPDVWGNNILLRDAHIYHDGGYAVYYSEGNTVYSATFPVFDNADDALHYLQTGDDSNAINAPIFDFPGLADGILEVLHPLTGINFSPNVMPGLNTALATAAAALPGAEPASQEENTKAYTSKMAATVKANLPATEPDPEPEPDPDPDPSDDIITDDYKVNLTTIFPFCLPFDFINLLNALAADPEAPCFEIPVVIPPLGIDMSVKLDMAFLDPVMEIFRLGELVSFIILLIGATHKMIRW